MIVDYLPQHTPPSVSPTLLSIWKTRYIAKAENISTDSGNFRQYPLEFAASYTGRKRTVRKLSDSLITEASHRAAIKTKGLYLHHEYLQINSTVDLARFTIQTTPILLEYFQKQSPLVIYPEDSATVSSEIQVGIAEISGLANRLEYCFSQFQGHYSATQDWLVHCFLTSQINLTSQSLLDALDPVEQAMFRPYCYFLEDFIAIPWWQLCLLAENYDQASPQYQLMRRLLSHAPEISLATYTRWADTFTMYSGARGDLRDPKIRRSSLRDLDMFQVYLWLSLLQGSLDIIQYDLVIFCLYIFKGIGIPWEMTIVGIRLLMEEILIRLTNEEIEVAIAFIDGMMRTFETADQFRKF